MPGIENAFFDILEADSDRSNGNAQLWAGKMLGGRGLSASGGIQGLARFRGNLRGVFKSLFPDLMKADARKETPSATLMS
jgi:hypothetical protein